MSFDALALTVLLSGWLACGVLPWLVLSVATRGGAGLGMLPLSMVVAVFAALLVPILGATNLAGLWLSFGVALLAPAALLAIRRFALGATGRTAARASGVHQHHPRSVE